MEKFSLDPGVYSPNVSESSLFSSTIRDYENNKPFIQSQSEYADSISYGPSITDIINEVNQLGSQTDALINQENPTIPQVSGNGVGVQFDSNAIYSRLAQSLGSGKTSLKAQATPEIIGTQSDLDRYKDSGDFRTFGYVPSLGDEQEYRYGRGMTWGDTVGKALAGGGALASETFIEGWKGWGRMAEALFTWDASKLYGSEEERYEMAKRQEEIFNKYAIYNTEISEDSILNRQFFGNMLQQAGFAVGAAAQMGLEAFITGGIGKAISLSASAIAKGRALGTVIDVAEMVDKTRKAQQILSNSERVVNAFKNLPKAIIPLYGTAEDMVKASKAGAGAFQLGMMGAGGIRREISMFNMARSEAIFEAASTYKELEDKLVSEFTEKNGRAPNAQELERIRQKADDASSDNFFVNAGILTVMNKVQFGNMAKSFSNSRKIFGEGLTPFADDAFVVTGKVGDKTISKAYEKGFFGSLNSIGDITKTFGKKKAAWELGRSSFKGLLKFEGSEGAQELLQEASAKGLSDYYYDLYHGNKGYGSKMDSILSSIQNPLTDTQGLKTFLMGALTGRLIAPISYVGNKLNFSTEAKERNARLKEDIETVNTFFSTPGAYIKEQIANVKVQNKAAETMDEAVKNQDRYTFHNAKDSSFAKGIAAAIRLNLYDSFKSTLTEFSEEMTEEELKDTFGLQGTVADKKNVKAFTKKIVDQMDEYHTVYQNLMDKYGDKIMPELYVNNDKEDYEKVKLAKIVQHHAIEMLATNLFRAKQSTKRAVEITSEIAKNERIGASSVEIITKLGSEQAALDTEALLQKEIAQGEDMISSMSPEQRKIHENKKKELSLVSLWLDAYEDIMNAEPETYNQSVQERAYDSYKNLVNHYNEVSGKTTEISREDVDDNFLRTVDYILLNRDSKSFIDAMNVLADPYNMDVLTQAIRSGVVDANALLNKEHKEELENKTGTTTTTTPPPGTPPPPAGGTSGTPLSGSSGTSTSSGPIKIEPNTFYMYEGKKVMIKISPSGIHTVLEYVDNDPSKGVKLIVKQIGKAQFDAENNAGKFTTLTPVTPGSGTNADNDLELFLKEEYNALQKALAASGKPVPTYEDFKKTSGPALTKLFQDKIKKEKLEKAAAKVAEIKESLKNLNAKKLKATPKGYIDELDPSAAPIKRVSTLKNPKAFGETESEPEELDEISQRNADRGTIIDTLLRLFIEKKIKSLEDLKLEYNKHSLKEKTQGFNDNFLKNLFDIFTDMSKDLEDYEILADIPTLWGNIKWESNNIDGEFAGTIDLLAINKLTGDVYIIDLKTARGNRRNEKSKWFLKYKTDDSIQQSAYAELLRQRTGIQVKNVLIFPIQTSMNSEETSYISAIPNKGADGKFTMNVEINREIFPETPRQEIINTALAGSIEGIVINDANYQEWKKSKSGNPGYDKFEQEMRSALEMFSKLSPDQATEENLEDFMSGMAGFKNKEIRDKVIPMIIQKVKDSVNPKSGSDNKSNLNPKPILVNNGVITVQPPATESFSEIYTFEVADGKIVKGSYRSNFQGEYRDKEENKELDNPQEEYDRLTSNDINKVKVKDYEDSKQKWKSTIDALKIRLNTFNKSREDLKSIVENLEKELEKELKSAGANRSLVSSLYERYTKKITDLVAKADASFAEQIRKEELEKRRNDLIDNGIEIFEQDNTFDVVHSEDGVIAEQIANLEEAVNIGEEYVKNNPFSKENPRIKELEYNINQLEENLKARVEDFIKKGASAEEAEELAQREFPENDRKALEKMKEELAILKGTKPADNRELSPEQEKNPAIAYIVVRMPDGNFVALTDDTFEKFRFPGGQLDKNEDPKYSVIQLAEEQGWKVNRIDDVIASKMVEGKPVVWYLADKAHRLDSFKEKEFNTIPVTIDSNTAATYIDNASFVSGMTKVDTDLVNDGGYADRLVSKIDIPDYAIDIMILKQLGSKDNKLANLSFEEDYKQTAPSNSLANKTDEIKVSINPAGKLIYERTEVNTNYVFDVATSYFMPGKTVKFKVVTDGLEKVANRLTGDIYDKNDLFDKDWNAKSDKYDYIPIGVYADIRGKETLIGFLHEPQWIEYKSGETFPHIAIPDDQIGQNYPDIVKQEVLNNRKLRETVLDNYNKNHNFVMEAVVSDKSMGMLRVTTSIDKISNRLNPKIAEGGTNNRHGMFAIVRNGVIQTSQNVTPESLEKTDSFSPENIQKFEGLPVLLVPTPLGTLFPTFVKLPNISRNQAEFILEAWKAFTGKTNRPDIVQAVYDAMGMVPTAKSFSIGVLRSYIDHYITAVDERAISRTGTGADLPNGSARINITNKGGLELYVKDAAGNWYATDEPVTEVKELPADILDKLTNLKINIRFNNPKNDSLKGINNQEKATILSMNDGAIIKEEMTYNKYLMDRVGTYIDNGIATKTSTEDWVYFANPVIKMDPIKQTEPDPVESLKEEITTPPTSEDINNQPPDDIALRILQALNASTMSDKQVEEQKENCTRTKSTFEKELDELM